MSLGTMVVIGCIAVILMYVFIKFAVKNPDDIKKANAGLKAGESAAKGWIGKTWRKIVGG